MSNTVNNRKERNFHLLYSLKTKMTVRWTMEAAVTTVNRDHLGLSAYVTMDLSSLTTVKHAQTSMNAQFRASVASSVTTRGGPSDATAWTATCWSQTDAPAKLPVRGTYNDYIECLTEVLVAQHHFHLCHFFKW